MSLADDGQAREFSPMACFFCRSRDHDSHDRFVAVAEGCSPTRRDLIEKCTTVQALTQELFAKTDLNEWRTSGDPNKLAALRFLEQKVVTGLLNNTRRRLREDGSKLHRICLPCWSARVGRQN